MNPWIKAAVALALAVSTPNAQTYTYPRGATTAGGGTGLAPWQPAIPAKPPALASWTQVNGGGNGTFADARNAVVINSVSGNNLKALYLPTPGTAGSSFTVTTHILGSTAANQSPSFGLWVGDAGTKMIAFGFGSLGSSVDSVSVMNWSNSTTFASAPLQGSQTLKNGDWWMRIIYDGTNFTYQSSQTGTDNSTWTTWMQNSAAGFLVGAPAKIGFFSYSQTLAVNVKAILTYWSVSEP